MSKGNIFYGEVYSRTLKRVIDILLALLLLVIFFPISLIVTILIKLETFGPVLADTPKRVGVKRKLFKMYKFRSMIRNAHELLRKDPKLTKLYETYRKGSYKLYNDPRITKVGKYIRKYSLDEVPQLINVLKGDMSMVGPRAYYPDEIKEQLQKHPNAKKSLDTVLEVKPGITGFWQVYGRSEVHFNRRIKMDADYVEKLSFWYDIKIILKTPWAMISAKGAV